MPKQRQKKSIQAKRIIIHLFPLFTLLFFTACMSIAPYDNNSNNDDIATTTFDMVNQLRIRENLPPLKRLQELDKLAYSYSKELATRGTISHTADDGTNLEDRLFAANIREWNEAGENLALIAYDSDPAGSAVNAWKKSRGHWDNIITSHFNLSGMGVYTDKETETSYFTQIFLYRKQ